MKALIISSVRNEVLPLQLLSICTPRLALSLPLAQAQNFPSMNFSAYSRLAAVLVLGTVTAAVSKRPDWHVNSLKATIVVNPDSSLLVDETQVIPENDRNFGLRCDIPIGDEDRWDRNHNPGHTDDNGLRVKVQKVTVNGQPVAFHIDHYRHTFYQVIVDRNNQLYSDEPGQHVLNVVYRVTGAIRSVGAADELYWNVAGQKLSIRYDSQSVRVVLPAGVPVESVQASSYAGGFNSPVGTEKFSDGVEFSIDNALPHQSLSITMRWPQGYIHRDNFEGRYGPPYFLAPLLLLAIYVSARFYLRRNFEPCSTAPQYEPPAGLSPAALRYVMHGIIDGTSVAACLADLTVRGYIEAQAKGASFSFWRTSKCDTDLGKLPSEEAAIAELLFDPSANVVDPACGPVNDYQDLSALNRNPPISNRQLERVVAFGPADPRVNVLIGAIRTRMKPELDGKYFTWNSWIAFLGMAATFIFGLAVVLSTGQKSSSLFLAIWSFFFFQCFCSVVGMALFGRQINPLRMVLFALVFTGVVSLVARELARDISWVAVTSYIAMMVVNGLFIPLLRTPTGEGCKLLFQIRGYKLFLAETELDRLKALGQSPASMPKIASLPYAIALDLREPWGDAMSNTFASAAASV